MTEPHLWALRWTTVALAAALGAFILVEVIG